MAAFSSLATRTSSYGDRVKKSNPRRSAVDMFIVHHAAMSSMAGLLGIFAADGGRGTSANYAIGPHGEIVGAVPESLRAWTSGGKRDGATVDGSVFDHRAVTVEVCNAPGAGDANGWPVTDEAFDALARLIADVATRHSFPIDRDHVVNHGELLTRFKASYATACPGQMKHRMDELIDLARTYQQGGIDRPANESEEDDMAMSDDEKNILLGAVGRIEKAVYSLTQALNRVETDGAINRWALVNDKAGARRMLADIQVALAQLPQIDVEPTQIDDAMIGRIAEAVADEQAERLRD